MTCNEFNAHQVMTSVTLNSNANNLSDFVLFHALLIFVLFRALCVIVGLVGENLFIWSLSVSEEGSCPKYHTSSNFSFLSTIPFSLMSIWLFINLIIITTMLSDSILIIPRPAVVGRYFIRRLTGGGGGGKFT